MKVEAVHAPLTYRWPGGEVQLVPGQPVDLPESRALRLLQRAPGKVRAVPASGESPEVVIESAVCRPVYWESMDGRMHGPAPVRFMARVGSPTHPEFWLCVEAPGRTVWIRDDRLRRRPVA